MNKWLFSMLVILTTFLMGSSFAIGKIGLSYTTPLLLVGIRFSLAGVIMAIAVRLLRIPHPKAFFQWIKIAVIGSFQTAGVMSCIFLSLRTISAGQSSILTFMNPLLVVIFGTIFMKLSYNLRQWTGVILGFIGVFITLGAKLSFEIGSILAFLSAVSWAIGTLLIKKWGNEFNTWVLTAYQMLFGGIILLIGSLILENPYFRITGTSISIVLWLAIMASIVQFAGWFYLLQKGDPGKTSAFLFLAPFFGVLSGWLILDETINWYVTIGGLCIFTGIFLVNWTSSRKMEAGSLETSLNK
ncbi:MULTISPECIES: DMT family transporter [Ureibacillus]|jgi:probable blue pigment (indigoidine) exporter|uniref:Drug/metabolite transporter (DMT)-like permease n=1 Tax=Ureibacillus thermosphaericus TaxID=51173 RepID=A0A840PQ00_URETH|nr:DMT family transporter [Ureibacillus thermosphaericus]MBB5148000.1 drug/metabolite transporter (DMT)-like permease [Ureibacillus thermosphaericus]NKZ30711.1 DMT family transporter [Ureibacillus thermosphaericus]